MIRKIVLLLALAAFACPTIAAETGGLAPAFKSVGIDGKQYTLESVKDAKAIVVCFTGTECPVASIYEDRFIDFVKNYQEKGVQFIAIDVNPGKIEDVKAHVAEKKLNFPYTIDESQASAKAYHARVTPHLFLLDQDRKIVYAGAFDDSMFPSKVKKTFLADAVDAVLQGEEIKVKTTKPVGCSILLKR